MYRQIQHQSLVGMKSFGESDKENKNANPRTNLHSLHNAAQKCGRYFELNVIQKFILNARVVKGWCQPNSVSSVTVYLSGTGPELENNPSMRVQTNLSG